MHEIIDASILAGGGQLLKTDIRIDHTFSSDRDSRRRKNHWYIEILKEEIAADPADDTRLDFLAAEYHQFEMFPEATEIAERIVNLRPRIRGRICSWGCITCCINPIGRGRARISNRR